MSGLQKAAMNDYNLTIGELKSASAREDIDTIVSVVTHQGTIRKEAQNSSVTVLQPLTNYPVPGSTTPLFRSIDTLIDMLESVPDKQDATFLIIAVTDGQDNVASVYDRQRFSTRIKQLQSTDRWTFVFRVPREYKSALAQMGIPEGNIQEWEQTERGMRESTVQTVSAVSNYYSGVKRGTTSTRSFYADIGKLSSNQVVGAMADISNEVAIYPVPQRSEISSFLSLKTGHSYRKGTGFYQLSKPEKAVQDYKVIVARNKNTGAVYGGTTQIRELLGLPTSGTISLKPGTHGDWDVFIQSTSSNRVLVPGTSALYWEKA